MHFLKNKVVSTSVKTSKNVVDTSKELVRTARTHGLNVVVNHTPDIYDKHAELASGVTKFAIGNSVMVGRNGVRVMRNGTNFYRNKKIKNRQKELLKLKTQLQAKEQLLKKGKDEDGSILNIEKKVLLKKEILKRSKEIHSFTEKIQKDISKVNKARGFSIKRSMRETIRNQTRKAVVSIKRDNSMGNQVIGQSSLMIWKIRKYKNSALRGVQLIRTIITSAISFITSIPGIIVTLVTSIPVIIVMICIFMVLSLISSELEMSPRIANFTTKEIKLENAYQTALLPDEILAITSALGWSTQSVEDYEVLLSFAFDQTRGEKPSFETMLDNIFYKYNPVNYFPIGQPIHMEESTNYYYYHNEEGNIGNLGNDKVVHKTLTNEQWLNIYPLFKNGTDKEKGQWKNEEFIQQLKQDCREALKQNAYNYLATFIQIENEPDIFTYPVIQNSGQGSSVVGYRSLMLGSEVDNSFHYGTDIAAPKNTPVYAVMDGVVVHADNSQTVEGSAAGLWGAGNSVIIRKEIIDAKGNPAYLYVMVAHLNTNTVTVKLGDTITAGTQIGGVGTTGTSTGDHLHFQVWMTRTKMDQVREGDWVSVLPNKFTDEMTGKTYDVESGDYTIILDGTMFYDIDYRNQIYKR